MNDDANERKVKTSPIGTFSYPHLHAPSPNKLKKSPLYPTGTPEYSVRVIFDQGQNMQEMVRHAEQALVERFGVLAGPPGLKKWRDAGYKTPIKSCDDHARAHGGEYDGGMAPGLYYIEFRGEADKGKPKVVDNNVQPIREAGKVYGGCRGCVSYMPYTYNTGGNKGVNFGLRNAQVTGDGPRLGAGGSEPEEDFRPASRGPVDANESMV